MGAEMPSGKFDGPTINYGSGATRNELLQASDPQIEDAVKYSDPMALRGLIYQLTGDETLADIKVTKQRIFMAEAVVPASDDGIVLIQKRAAEFLKAYRDKGAQPLGPGPMDRLPRSLALAAGEDINPDELAMWIEEAAIDPYARALVWPKTPSPEKLSQFSVAVIGAGMGGLGAAVQLRKAGIPYLIIEKNPDVGGTWYENRYPGARVDTPSRAYTHIFGADFVFDYAFSPQADNERYFHWVTDKFQLRDNIKFNTEVTSLTWDETTSLWRIEATGPGGHATFHANAVVCASGLLARPNVPEFEGAADFKGQIFHTARWPEGLDLSGRRVAVIGTGATGYQMVPEIAKAASHVYMLQRKPQWLFDVEGYLSPLPDQVTWLDRNLPYHINFLRFRTNWLTGEHVYGEVFNLDPEWQDAVGRSALNKTVVEDRTAYVKKILASHPDLIDKMIPEHPPFSARPILVDSQYNVCHALMRDNVDLVSGGIDRITEKGFVSGGVEHDVDIIIYATGFRANDLLWPMEITGKGGVTVEQAWEKDGCRAYVAGSMMPGFPNFFIIYGPNTNPAQGGGIVNHEEMVTRFALECMAALILEDKKSVDVSPDAFERYNALLDGREKLKIYTDRRAQNFFLNKHNRSSVMCPFGPSELWKMLRERQPGDLIFD